jgi:hypothetical protein
LLTSVSLLRLWPSIPRPRPYSQLRQPHDKSRGFGPRKEIKMAKMFINDVEVVDYEVVVDRVSALDDYEAWFSYAVLADGREATEEELAELNEKYDYVVGDEVFASQVCAADFMD